jgi:voltage-gated potassium channel
MYLLVSGRFRIALLALTVVFVIGTAGYWLIEGWTLLESLYMTAITISTVGYSEIEPLSSGGKIFSIFLIIGGVGIMFYTVTIVAEYVAEGHFGSTIGRRRMKEQIKRLENHFVICGYGRVGREVAATVKNEGVPFVVIENNKARLDLANEDGCLFLEGDVTSDDTLAEAGVGRARALIAAVGNDAGNVYVTLSAREMKPDIFIAARASARDSEHKLIRAGADRIVFPQRLGGHRMAMVAMRPWVVDSIDNTGYSQNRELALEDISITSDSPIAGMTIEEGQSSCQGGIIVAMKKRDGSLVANPPMETLIEVGDEVVIIGTRQQLCTLEGFTTQ